MTRIPKDEAGRITMAQQIANALNTNTNLSDSPITKTDFVAMLGAFIAKHDSIMFKEAGLRVEYGEKEEMEEDLADAMQRIIDFLDSKTGGDPEQLATVGVSVSASAPTKQPPGQPRNLEVLSQGEGTVFLDWKNPADGGRVASYRIERRERPAGTFETCFATNKTEIQLTGQPRGKELEYRIVGYNSNGDSTPSNTVMAVL